MLGLFLDDDIKIFHLFCEALKRINGNTKCLHAFDGIEALQMLNDPLVIVLPDYIFLNTNVRKLGGKEFLDKIKEHPEFRRIPVVFYSASSTWIEIHTILHLGTVSFLNKSSNFNELEIILREILEGRT